MTVESLEDVTPEGRFASCKYVSVENAEYREYLSESDVNGLHVVHFCHGPITKCRAKRAKV
eukprot:11975107-Karenia_brevis.AAC.1